MSLVAKLVNPTLAPLRLQQAVTSLTPTPPLIASTARTSMLTATFHL
jgi:hypothetical protein